MAEMLAFTDNPLVVEIASNDGYLLQYFNQYSFRIRGIEPSENVANAAIAKGVPTTIAFFGSITAITEVSLRGKADLIIANNVLAHVPDVHDFVEGIRILLKEGGTATIEVPHLLNLIKDLQFDTIYHEHYSYFWLHTIIYILWRHGLRVFNVEKLPNLGGSLRVFVSHQTDIRPKDPSVEALLSEEELFGYDHDRTYIDFQRAVTVTKCHLLEFLTKMTIGHKSVAGYGAPAKATVLLNYCGIGADLLPYTVDTTPYKQGKYIPGVQIPIFHEDHIFADRPDYLLLFPWNLKKEIIGRIGGQVSSWGGRFVTAIPELTIA
jgi:SAM-dependent methyltransferase